MTNNGYWEIAYQVYVDGEEKLVVIGTSKKDAMNMFKDQWEIACPNLSVPKRYRIRLQEVDRTSWGAI